MNLVSLVEIVFFFPCFCTQKGLLSSKLQINQFYRYKGSWSSQRYCSLTLFLPWYFDYTFALREGG